jgi:hypothetical protein
MPRRARKRIVTDPEARNARALVRRYRIGYRRNPETGREVRMAEALGLRLLAAEPW